MWNSTKGGSSLKMVFVVFESATRDLGTQRQVCQAYTRSLRSDKLRFRHGGSCLFIVSLLWVEAYLDHIFSGSMWPVKSLV